MLRRAAAQAGARACCHARQARLSALQTPLNCSMFCCALGGPHAHLHHRGLWLMLNILMHAPAARARPAGRWPLCALPCLILSRLPIA